MPGHPGPNDVSPNGNQPPRHGAGSFLSSASSLSPWPRSARCAVRRRPQSRMSLHSSPSGPRSATGSFGVRASRTSLRISSRRKRDTSCEFSSACGLLSAAVVRCFLVHLDSVAQKCNVRPERYWNLPQVTFICDLLIVAGTLPWAEEDGARSPVACSSPSLPSRTRLPAKAAIPSSSTLASSRTIPVTLRTSDATLRPRAPPSPLTSSRAGNTLSRMRLTAA